MMEVIKKIGKPKLLAGAVCLALFVVWVGLKKKPDGELSVPIQRGSIIESVYGIGTVTANQTFQFKSGVTSTTREIFVKEGDLVKEGDSLLTLQENVVIKSPFDGIVTLLPYKVGENVFSGTIAVEVVNLLDRYLLVSLEQRGALRVRKGQTARLSFDGLRDQSFEGIVDSIYSRGNDFLIRIHIADLPPQILPGMTADTAIGIEERNDVLLIPVAAIENGLVNVDRGPIRDKVPVKLGLVDGAFAEVVSGELKEGDRLVLKKKIGK